MTILETKLLQSFNKIENHFSSGDFQFSPKVTKNPATDPPSTIFTGSSSLLVKIGSKNQFLHLS
ncbi:MAG: hypothetical protein ACI9XO_004413 [Paraglaciecola sp.]|jgi:hypothetical protein